MGAAAGFKSCLLMVLGNLDSSELVIYWEVDLGAVEVLNLDYEKMHTEREERDGVLVAPYPQIPLSCKRGLRISARIVNQKKRGVGM